jgi:hypothetical protein
VGRENKCLEEPGRVRKMPFRRACIGHRLNLTILARERTRELLGHLPGSFVPRAQLIRRRIRLEEIVGCFYPFSA